jgi:His-Xaa-Ser system protein HxsD
MVDSHVVLGPPLEDGGYKCILLDSSVYRLPSAKKAAYKFGDRCYVLIEGGTDGHIRVYLRPKDSNLDIESVVGDYLNEVLDQDLRESIAEQTDDLRNLIIAHAFSQTSLIETDLETAPYAPDNFGIVDSDKQAAE